MESPLYSFLRSNRRDRHDSQGLRSRQGALSELTASLVAANQKQKRQLSQLLSQLTKVEKKMQDLHARKERERQAVEGKNSV